MPRDLVVGNGTLLINIDRNQNIRDLYYPHVGLYNHVNGYRNRVGIWVDGQFSWLDDTWSVNMAYRPGTLTTDVYASNGRIGVGLRFNDTVHPKLNLFLRRVSVENLHPGERDIRVFFHHDFRLCETDIGDTAFFHPYTGSMVHFKRDCYVLVNGRAHDIGIFEYAAGIKEFGGAEGTWRDAEDGSLGMHPIEQGSVDSTVSFKLQTPGGGTAVLDYWMAVGRSLEEVIALHDTVISISSTSMIAESESYWKSWLAKGSCPPVEPGSIPSGLVDLYERSLLTIQTQIDRSGGILAANDTDIMQTARAHYSYVWPRDGALVANALDTAGYGEPSRRFFSFCTALLSPNRPFFLQKYGPDGTVGATWHPWVIGGEPEVPCQQDSTALVVWAIGKHFDKWGEKEFNRSLYEDLVVPAVDHIIRELDPATKLPRPSYDLWEQRRGIHLFTCCTVYGALSAATKLSLAYDPEGVEWYRKARNDLKKAILQRLFDPNLSRFVRSLDVAPGGELVPDLTIDASMAGVFLFDVLPAGDIRIASTMRAIYDRLWVRSPIGGLARYEDDSYFQVSTDVRNVPGNPWFVTTLWLAEWYIMTAASMRDMEPALELLQWAARNASEAGLLSEQIHPFTGQPLSVMPLTWSHAAYVSAFLKYQTKARKLAEHKADKA